jgi:hypothetical protein
MIVIVERVVGLVVLLLQSEEELPQLLGGNGVLLDEPVLGEDNPHHSVLVQFGLHFQHVEVHRIDDVVALIHLELIDLQPRVRVLREVGQLIRSLGL